MTSLGHVKPRFWAFWCLFRLKRKLKPLPSYFCMKFNYCEVNQRIGRCITNEVSFNKCFFVFKLHIRNNGWFKNLSLLTFVQIRLQISDFLFVQMFFSGWGILKMMHDRKIPIRSGFDFDFKRKNAPKFS